MKRSYDGHIAGDMDLSSIIGIGQIPYLRNIPADLWGVPAIMHTAAVAIIAANAALEFFPQLLPIVKPAIATAAVYAVLAKEGAIDATYLAGYFDLRYSHEAPLLKDFQSKWKASPNTYSKILGGQGSYEPYRMEEFLYEKPFANLRVHSVLNSNWQDENKDTLGLFSFDSSSGKYVGVAANFSSSSPLDFKSSSHWETFGAKKVRWDNSVQGVEGKVPIRHADRYALPGFMVTDFIKKYEFEIDDLMPHRLRQIRLNFNFEEEIAWECDVSKPETDATACIVYKRTPASNWSKI